MSRERQPLPTVREDLKCALCTEVTTEMLILVKPMVLPPLLVHTSCFLQHCADGTADSTFDTDNRWDGQ